MRRCRTFAITIPFIRNATAACHKIIQGKPFDSGPNDSPLLEDFTKKVTALSKPDGATRDRLVADATKALNESVKPAYEELIAFLEEQAKRATEDLPKLFEPTTVPTLVLYGPEDHVVLPSFPYKMAAACLECTGPLMVPNAGHFIVLERPDVPANLLNSAA